MKGFVNYIAGIIGLVFENVLEPVLITFIQAYITFEMKRFKTFWGWLIYWAFTGLLKLIDYFFSIFNFFAGSEDVTLTQNTYDSLGNVVGSKTTRGSIIEVLFEVDHIQKAFLVITIFAVGLAIVFTIVGVVKSMSDMTLEDKNPISKVLGSALKSAFTFMLVPFFCIFMIRISGLVLDGVETALSAQTKTQRPTIGTMIWVCSSMNAAKNSNYNIDTSRNPEKLGFSDSLRAPYYEGRKSWNLGSSTLTNDFTLGEFDFIMGFISAIFMLIMLMGVTLLLVRRILELLVLYMVSPFFVAMMPLDEGEMFNKWKDLFIAKFFSAFGSVFAMRIYMLVIPVIVNGGINLYPSNANIAMFLKNILILGGAWAFYKSQHMLLRILNPEAAMAAEQTTGFVVNVAKQTANAALQVGMMAATGGASGAASAASAGAKMASAGMSGMQESMMRMHEMESNASK